MIIRKAILADAEGITRVHIGSWEETDKKLINDSIPKTVSHAKRLDAWKKAIRTQYRNYFIYVAQHDNGDIIGFAVGAENRSKNHPYDGELRGIYVLDTFQGQGVGDRLFHAVTQELHTIGLHSMIAWVLQDNPSLSFYEKYSPLLVATKYIESLQATGIAYGWPSLDTI